MERSVKEKQKGMVPLKETEKTKAKNIGFGTKNTGSRKRGKKHQGNTHLQP